CAEKFRWLTWSPAVPATRPFSKPVAAKTSRRSNARGALLSSKNFRATRWAKCRNIYWEPPPSEDPDGGFRGYPFCQDWRLSGCAGISAGGAGSPGRRSRRGDAEISRGGHIPRRSDLARHAAV